MDSLLAVFVDDAGAGNKGLDSLSWVNLNQPLAKVWTRPASQIRATGRYVRTGPVGVKPIAGRGTEPVGVQMEGKLKTSRRKSAR